MSYKISAIVEVPLAWSRQEAVAHVRATQCHAMTITPASPCVCEEALTEQSQREFLNTPEEIVLELGPEFWLLAAVKRGDKATQVDTKRADGGRHTLLFMDSGERGHGNKRIFRIR